MDIFVLASGSGGNATYVRIGRSNILLDAGISLRQIVSRMNQKGESPDPIDHIFITHEHGDHISGLLSVQKKNGSMVHMTMGTYKNLPYRIRDNLDKDKLRIASYNEPVILDGFSFLPFMTFHDALEPCGYRFTEGGKSLVYLTDTGYYPQKGFDPIRNADAYIIESNHEPEMLLESERPWLLKKRILDDQGHLSNDDSAFLIANIIGERTRKIILAHLSQECNTEECALRAYRKIFKKNGISVDNYEIVCAKQDEPIGVISL